MSQKLSKEHIQEICELYTSGESATVLSQRFGVHVQRIYKALKASGQKPDRSRVPTHKNIPKKVGKLSIKEVFRQKSFPRRWMAKCLCDCGVECVYELARVTGKVGPNKSCGCVMSLGKIGLKNVAWKGSRTGDRDISGTYINRIRKSAKERGLSFNLTVDYLHELFINQDGKCALSGINLTLIRSREEGTASLDRINSDLGYQEGNVQWVHKTMNRMKMDINQDEFINFCKMVAKTHN